MEENKTFTTVDDLIKQAEEQYTQFIKDGKYKDLLLSMSNLNCYSITNQLLILSQLPTARCVNGMKVWNYNHRNIIKGQKAIKIIAPLIEKRKEEILDADGNVVDTKEVEIVGYKVSYVFDISQTEGRELYEFKCDELTAVENFDTIKEALERTARGYSFEYKPLEESVDGYCDYENKQIVIKDGMPHEKTLTTLIHEIGHALAEERVRVNFKGLTPKEQRQIREIEAESIALVVSNRLGLHTADFNMAYITTWSDGDIEKFKDNINVVRSVSYQILSSVEPAVQNALREKEKGIEKAEENTQEATQGEEQTSNQQTEQTAEKEPEIEPISEEKPKKTRTRTKKSEVEQC